MTDYTEETEIYLLMSQNEKKARGFKDRNKSFTFAFTCRNKAKRFLENARIFGMLSDVNLLYQMTVGEYFQWQEEGKTTADLTIDPAPDMLEHSVFALSRFQNN